MQEEASSACYAVTREVVPGIVNSDEDSPHSFAAYQGEKERSRQTDRLSVRQADGLSDIQTDIWHT